VGGACRLRPGLRPAVTLAVLLLCRPLPAFHLDIVVGETGGRLEASFCPAGSAGCDAVPALAALGLPEGTLPVEGATGNSIFVTDFGDFAGGPFATDDPGFFADPGTLPADVLLRYEITAPLAFWDPSAAQWTEDPPGDVRVRLAGGIDVIADGSCGLLVCFEPSSTLITGGGVAGSPSLVIDQSGPDGSLHTHLDWFLEHPDGTRGGPEGAYTLEMLIAAEGFESSAPFTLLFNRGLGDAAFGEALLALVNAEPPPPAEPGAVIAWEPGELHVASGETFSVPAAGNGAAEPFVLAAAGLSGGGVIELGGNELRITPGADSLFTGRITGAGGLTKRGGERLVLSGESSYTGDTRVSGPLRIGDSRNLGARDSTLNLEAAVLELAADVRLERRTRVNAASVLDTGKHRLHLGGPLEGASDLVKRGSGELRLSGAKAFEGELGIEAGSLHLDGSLGGGLRLDPGTTLSGRGEVTGDIVLARDAIYRVTVAPAAITGGVFEAGGRIRIEDARLRIDGLPGDWPLSSEHRILTAGQGITGRFAAIDNALAFLEPRLLYRPRAVELRLLRNDRGLVDFVDDAEQVGAAAALDTLRLEGTGGDARVLAGLTAEQVPGVVAAVSGRSLTALPRAGAARARATLRQVAARLAHVAPRSGRGDIAAGLSGQAVLLAMAGRRHGEPVLAAASRAAARQAPQPRHGVWVRALTGIGDFDLGPQASAGGDHAGLVFGYDWQAAEAATVGLFGVYSDAEVNQEEPKAGAGITAWQAGAYARLRAGRWQVDAVAAYGRDRYETNRTLALGGERRTATAAFDGDTLSAYVEAAWNPSQPAGLQPWAAVQWTVQAHEAYREAGAGGLGLAVGAGEARSLRSLLGARLRGRLATLASGAVTAELRLAWAHELKDDAALRARLLGDPRATLFTVRGVPAGADSAVLGAGIMARLNRHAQAFADFDGELNSAQRSYTLSAGVRLRW